MPQNIIKRVISKLFTWATEMDEKPNGLYTGPTEDTFKSRARIVMENADSPVKTNITPVPTSKRNFEWWNEHMLERQQTRGEICSIPSFAEIAIDTKVPICIALFGDAHIGADSVDYKLLAHHAEIIKEHPLM